MSRWMTPLRWAKSRLRAASRTHLTATATGNAPSHAHLQGLVDRAHAAPANAVDNFVIAQALGNRRLFSRGFSTCCGRAEQVGQPAAVGVGEPLRVVFQRQGQASSLTVISLFPAYRQPDCRLSRIGPGDSMSSVGGDQDVNAGSQFEGRVAVREL